MSNVMDEKNRTKGIDAQRLNISIAKAVANSIKTTLGPKGMDKMIVDEFGHVTISNDGATILEEMNINHPIGKMMTSVAKTQDNEIGDGTTTAVVLAGGLLEKAEGLLDDGVHASSIIKGYRLASEEAKRIYESVSFDSGSIEDQLNVAITTMTGKTAEGTTKLAQFVVDALTNVSDKDNIRIEKNIGGKIEDSYLLNGVVLNKEFSGTAECPSVNITVALLNCPLEVKTPENDVKFEISSAETYNSFLQNEEDTVKKQIDVLEKLGVNIVITQKNIDGLAQHYLDKAGIRSIGRVTRQDVLMLSKLLCVSIAHNITKDEVEIVNVDKIIQQKVCGEKKIFIEPKKSTYSTIMVYGSTSHVVDEVERAIHDAIGTVYSVVCGNKIVYGGGSPEIRVAVKLREYANTISGKEQLAINCFADALEIIPKTLSETAGLDPIDSLVKLRSEHNKGFMFGVNVLESKISDFDKSGVIEPLQIKLQALSSASEIVELILRIDDVVLGEAKDKPL